MSLSHDILILKDNTCYLRVITVCVITFCVNKVITFCVEKLLHFALKTLLHFASILLHFALVLYFAAIVITFCVSITFCGDYYILRRNKPSTAVKRLGQFFFLFREISLKWNHKQEYIITAVECKCIPISLT